jgi:membrane-associated phospholipid phosphatase
VIELARHLRERIAQLSADLNVCPPATSSGRAGASWLLAIAAISSLLGLLLYLWGGHQAGFQLLNHWSRYLPAWCWENLTFVGDGLFVLTLSLFIARRHPQLVWAGLLGALVGIAYVHGLKDLLQVARPAGSLEAGSFQLIGPGHRKGSFPSGHALSIFLLGSLAVYYLRSTFWRFLTLLIVTLIGFSRVAVGVHWPLDVLAGAFGGSLSALAGIMLSARLRWGVRPLGHLILVTLLAVSAALLIGYHRDYPGAALLGVVVGVAALVVFVRDYFFPDS